jgi:hypothetical protein
MSKNDRYKTLASQQMSRRNFLVISNIEALRIENLKPTRRFFCK